MFMSACSRSSAERVDTAHSCALNTQNRLTQFCALCTQQTWKGDARTANRLKASRLHRRETTVKPRGVMSRTGLGIVLPRTALTLG